MTSTATVRTNTPAIALVCAALIVVADLARSDAPTDALLLRSFDVAAAELRRLADNGNQEAAYRLAALYQRGLGVPRDPDKAHDIYARLAADGHRAAALALSRKSDDQSWFDPAQDDAATRLVWAAVLRTSFFGHPGLHFDGGS